MKYLVYAKRGGEMGEECNSVYDGYEIVESKGIVLAIFDWWKVVKENKTFKEDIFELYVDVDGFYSVKTKDNYLFYKVCVIPLYKYGSEQPQDLDSLNVNDMY